MYWWRTCSGGASEPQGGAAVGAARVLGHHQGGWRRRCRRMLDAGRRGGPLQHEGRGRESRESEHGDREKRWGDETWAPPHRSGPHRALDYIYARGHSVATAMAPKRKKPDEENDAPPAFLLKTKRFVVNLARLKGSMGLGIDDQHATLSKTRRRLLGLALRRVAGWRPVMPLAAPSSG